MNWMCKCINSHLYVYYQCFYFLLHDSRVKKSVKFICLLLCETDDECGTGTGSGTGDSVHDYCVKVCCNGEIVDYSVLRGDG